MGVSSLEEALILASRKMHPLNAPPPGKMHPLIYMVSNLLFWGMRKTAEIEKKRNKKRRMFFSGQYVIINRLCNPCQR